MGKPAAKHPAHIACLESLWNADIENRLTVVPILELVSRINDTRYIHLTCNTREELAHNLGKLARRRGYRVLYLSLHGKPGEIVLDAGRLDIETLAGMMGERFRGWVVHFGCCSTIAVAPRRIRAFIAATGVAMVSGYRQDVNWIATAALDLIYFDWLQYYRDTRRLWRDFSRQYGSLIRQTGLRAIHG